MMAAAPSMSSGTTPHTALNGRLHPRGATAAAAASSLCSSLCVLLYVFLVFVIDMWMFILFLNVGYVIVFLDVDGSQSDGELLELDAMARIELMH